MAAVCCDSGVGGVQPLRVRHCYDCQRCVYKYDHHCFWIGAATRWDGGESMCVCVCVCATRGEL